MLDRNPPEFARLVAADDHMGWDEHGPDYARGLRYLSPEAKKRLQAMRSRRTEPKKPAPRRGARPASHGRVRGSELRVLRLEVSPQDRVAFAQEPGSGPFRQRLHGEASARTGGLGTPSDLPMRAELGHRIA